MRDLVLLDRHEAELRTLLDMERGVEAAAYVVFGRSAIRRDPWTGDARVRLVSHRVIPISAEEQISASAVHVTWSTRGFVRELARASGEQLVLGIVHSHPGGSAVFSPQDDRNEAELIRAAASRARQPAVRRGRNHGIAGLEGLRRSRAYLPDDCHRGAVAGLRRV